VGEVDELLSRLVELIESNPHYLTRRDDDWWPARIGHDGDGWNGAPALIAAHTKPRRFDWCRSSGPQEVVWDSAVLRASECANVGIPYVSRHRERRS